MSLASSIRACFQENAPSRIWDVWFSLWMEIVFKKWWLNVGSINFRVSESTARVIPASAKFQFVLKFLINSGYFKWKWRGINIDNCFHNILHMHCMRDTTALFFKIHKIYEKTGNFNPPIQRDTVTATLKKHSIKRSRPHIPINPDDF